jgi:hypothetical protein
MRVDFCFVLCAALFTNICSVCRVFVTTAATMAWVVGMADNNDGDETQSEKQTRHNKSENTIMIIIAEFCV